MGLKKATIDRALASYRRGYEDGVEEGLRRASLQHELLEANLEDERKRIEADGTADSESES